MVMRLQPQIIIYGSDPDDLFREYKEHGIRIVHFYSDCYLAHKAVNA